MAKYLSLYDEAVRRNEIVMPTEEEFVMKLVHSALLDRVNVKSNYIGFINEFIFGILIGDAILENDLKIKEVTDKYLNLLLTAYVVESEEKRKEIYEIIKSGNIKMSSEQKLILDMNLIGKLNHDFVDEYISSITFRSTFNMKTGCYFYNCVFESCTFENSVLENVMFEGCHFINCVFYGVEIVNAGTIEEESIFISCTGYEKLSDELHRSIGTGEKTDSNELNYEKIVLEQFWMKGSNAADPRKTYRTLCKGVKQKDKAKVLAAVDTLIHRKILVRLTYCLELNFGKMTEIKAILGR